MQNEPSECAVQTRLESVARISRRQNEDLFNLAICLSQTLARLRGEHPQANKASEKPTPNGMLAEIELSLQERDETIL